MTAEITLAPCPWCGGGQTQIHVNKGTWNGRDYGEPVSVEVRHWCSQEAGQLSRMISRAGRDEASAIAAWNRRAQAAPQGPAPQYRLLQAGIDVIEATDEFLSNDTLTWAVDPGRVFVGMPYVARVLRPARRVITGGA